MENEKCYTNMIKVNISVIGLSGGEVFKGKKGVGKSCLCNRLTQPNNYKSSYNFMIELNDSYSKKINNSHWLSWGFVERQSRGVTFQFRFIEQTVMIEDVSDCSLDYGKMYIDCATSPEFGNVSKAQILGPIAYHMTHFTDKTSVDLFLLVYDVSIVEGRDPNNQDIIFKRLFDKIISTQLPVIVASTKHDIASPNLVDRLSVILMNDPYCLYPVIETSASLGVNINTIIDIATVLCQDGIDAIINIPLSYKKAFSIEASHNRNYIEELKRLAVTVLSGDGWQMPWTELRLLDSVCVWMERLESDLVVDIFEKVRMEIQLERRTSHLHRCRGILLELMNQFSALFNEIDTGRDVKSVIKSFLNDPSFMSHFVVFDQDVEFFDFASNADLLPRCVIDERYDCNLLEVFNEFIDRRILEEQLLQRLLGETEINLRKSVPELREYLRNSMNGESIDESIIIHAVKRFRKQHIQTLECQFLESLQENVALFIRHSLNPLKEKLSSDNFDRRSFLARITKEKNSKISLPDDDQWRIEWIGNYLNFFMSEDQNECMDNKSRHCPCSVDMVADILTDIGLRAENTASSPTHALSILIIGRGRVANRLKEVAISSSKEWDLGLCKVHQVKYDINILNSIDGAFRTLDNVHHNYNKCTGMCILLCLDDYNRQSWCTDTVALLEQTLGCQHVTYIVNDVCNDGVLVKPVNMRLTDETFKQESMMVHLRDLVSNCKTRIEPRIIWIVTVCGDNYQYKVLLKEVIGNIQRYSDPKQENDGEVSIYGRFTSPDIDGYQYRIRFISYHQAIKLLIRRFPSPAIEGLILVCSLDRLASINTCLAIGKFLPKESRSQYHCLLLGVPGQSNKWSEFVHIEADKLRIRYASLSTENKSTMLADFFASVFKGPPVLISLSSEVHESKSLSLVKDRTILDQYTKSNQSICKKCEKPRSKESVFNYCQTSESYDDVSLGPIFYDPVLGCANIDVFGDCGPEYEFNSVQDTCRKGTVIKCTVHKISEVNNYFSQPFRTRVRSKSGPDLRQFLHSNKTSSNSYSSGDYCSTCGANMIPINDSCNSQSSLQSTKITGDKSSSTKRLCTIFQDLFSPIRRLNESQSHDHRKSLIKTWSKKQKLKL